MLMFNYIIMKFNFITRFVKYVQERVLGIGILKLMSFSKTHRLYFFLVTSYRTISIFAYLF